MKEMLSNLGLMRAVLSVPPAEFVKSLRQITKNNPWCDAIERVLRSDQEIKESSFSGTPIDQKLLLNLPLMCVDLKEYLIQRRISQLERAKEGYLAESVGYMKSCKQFQSVAVKSNLKDVLKDRSYLEKVPRFALSKGETVKLLQRNFNRRVPYLVDRSETHKTFKLETVNDYWKESNQMVSEFIGQLIHPGTHLAADKSEKVRGLAQDFERARHMSSVISYDL